jgi:hypothetical protein
MWITSRLIHKKSLTHDVHDVFSDCSVVVFRSSLLRMFLIIGDLTFHQILSTFPAFQTWLPFAALYCSDNFCAFWGIIVFLVVVLVFFEKVCSVKNKFPPREKNISRGAEAKLFQASCVFVFCVSGFQPKSAYYIFEKNTYLEILLYRLRLKFLFSGQYVTSLPSFYFAFFSLFLGPLYSVLRKGGLPCISVPRVTSPSRCLR